MSRSLWLLFLVVALALAGCGPRETAEAGSAAVRPRVAVIGAAHNDTSTPFNLVSMPALIAHRYDGRDFRIGRVVATDLSSTRYSVTYRSGALRLSGQLTVPRRPGRFPVVVMAHGWQAPELYHSGAALARERAFLVARGYVVLVPDYRNYGTSDRDPERPVAHPRGYPQDVVDAVLALRAARLPYADTSRVGLLGRSMGGGVALAAAEARPRLFDALVLYAPVSSSAADNYERWVTGRGALDQRVRSTYGTPEENPRFWREASPRNFVGRLDMPIELHHGTSDDICPVWWSRATAAALLRAGKDVDLFEYPGEEHTFDAAWQTMMQRVAGFLGQHV